jgi:hypothetical protein
MSDTEVITSAKMQEIMETLNPEARRVFEKLILQVASQKPLNSIKKFIDNFEEDSPLDNLIARIMVQTIEEVGSAILKDMEFYKNSGISQYSGHDAAVIAVREVRKIADTLEAHLSHHDCPKCETQTH